MTFLLQYYRVFAVQKLRSLFLLAILLVGGWSLSQVLVAIFTCHPISAYWDRGGGGSDTHPQGGPARAPTTAAAPSCIPDLPQWYVNAAGNILTDVAIFVLPLPILGRLNLPRTQRLVLIGVFSLGFLCVLFPVTFYCLPKSFFLLSLSVSSFFCLFLFFLLFFFFFFPPPSKLPLTQPPLPAPSPSLSSASSTSSSSPTSRGTTSSPPAGPSPSSAPASPAPASPPCGPS
ncbi:hypothetical protein VTK73DRAFT_1478 [Phialemonium thermophilum]|uniref:Rhodopsin domain-containing protein n=1 Tax=Phialemonium thermophilum TaxID=223376 RepID=A0ABR3VTG2_9PEZI